MTNQKKIIGIDKSNGTDYGCKVTGYYEQGILFIEDIEYTEPVIKEENPYRTLNQHYNRGKVE